MKQRNTRHKQHLLAVIRQSEKAMAADEILDTIGSSINRTTVYRILDRFERDGLVHRVIGEDNKSYYAGCNACSPEHHEDQHAHFQCKSCHEVRCLNVDIQLPEVEGLRIEDRYILLTGLCESCQ